MSISRAMIESMALKLVGGIIVLLIGFPIAKVLTKAFNGMIAKTKIDVMLKKFAVQVVGILLKILVVIIAASTAGIQTSTFAAVIAAAGFAIGLAFSGSLANFAGGVLLLVLKPFKVGDFIEISGDAGVVEEIGIIYTKLLTVDNREVIIPNGGLSNSNITNYSAQNLRRVDLTFGASYDAPVEKVKSAIESVVKSHDLILETPAYFIRLGAHNSSSLDYTVRAWVNSGDYWSVHFDLLEQVKAKFDEEGIEIPYDKLDVNLNKLDA